MTSGNYRVWYNEHRVHSALGVKTPNEMLANIEPPAPIPIRSQDNDKTSIQITRQACRGDPRLPIITIAVQTNRAA